MTGKGDTPRPLSVSEEEFGKRFDAIDWSGHRNEWAEEEKQAAFAELQRRVDAEEEE